MIKRCEVCAEPIPNRPHQNNPRTCNAICACTLFKREHPDWGKTSPTRPENQE
jgi:hypothetical protein